MRNFVFLLVLAALPAAPAKYVTDAAGVLDDAREWELNERLAQYERETTNQVIVYVDRRVPEGTTIEEMGAEAIRTWRVGQEKTDNGAILFLFIDDRLSRIEVGYGLEGVLTDAMSKRILFDMRPRLREEDYTGAVEQGVQAIFDTIAMPLVVPPAPFQPHGIKAPPVQPERPLATDWGPAIVGGFLLFLLFIVIKLVKDSHSSIQPNWPTSQPPPDTPSNNTWPTFDTASPPTWSSSSSDSFPSSSPSSGSSSSDSSSFTGGGGSGGGGGASDGW